MLRIEIWVFGHQFRLVYDRVESCLRSNMDRDGQIRLAAFGRIREVNAWFGDALPWTPS
jgi:hypothetical protein